MSKWINLSLVSFLALVTLFLAWPRLHASIRFVPVDSAIDQYHQENVIPSEYLPDLIDYAREAIRIHDHYRYHDGLSQLYYLKGIDPFTAARDRRDSFQLSEDEAINTVQRAPAQPEAWLRIATVRAVLRVSPESVVEPWRMSIFTGRAHSSLLAPRVGLGLAYLEHLDNESRSMLRDQILLAWAVKPADLISELRTRDLRLERTGEIIGTVAPTVLDELEEQIARYR